MGILRKTGITQVIYLSKKQKENIKNVYLGDQGLDLGS